MVPLAGPGYEGRPLESPDVGLGRPGPERGHYLVTRSGAGMRL